MTQSLRNSLIFTGTIIVTAVTINLLASPGFLWFVFPVFGLLWWPLSAYFAGRKQPFAFAVSGTLLLCGLFLTTYLVASPGAHPWFIYPMLGVVWWPLSVYFSGKTKPLLFSLLGFCAITVLFVLLWALTGTSTHPWFIYPVLGVFWWPLSVWGGQKGTRAFSVAGGLHVILTLLVINLVASPAFWWWVYPAFFVLWWPISVLLGSRAKSIGFAFGSAAAASLFLFIMHRVHTPQFAPWYLFAVLPFFWWPISMLLSKRVNMLQNVLIGIIVFAMYYTGLIELLYGMGSQLSLYLLFAGAWLVYAMGLSKHRSAVGFATVNVVLLIVYFVLVHRFVTPELHAWYWYAFFPLAWWPVSAALKDKAVEPLPVAACAAAFLAYYGALNWLHAPGTPWVLFLTFPAVSAVIAAVCAPRKAWAAMSVWMALAGIAYFAAINLVYTPYAIWAVYPAFGILWWPLSMLLYGRKAKHEDEETTEV